MGNGEDQKYDSDHEDQNQKKSLNTAAANGEGIGQDSSAV
jgi:hypothetical protein